jgi:hypothetical protein
MMFAYIDVKNRPAGIFNDMAIEDFFDELK